MFEWKWLVLEEKLVEIKSTTKSSKILGKVSPNVCARARARLFREKRVSALYPNDTRKITCAKNFILGIFSQMTYRPRAWQTMTALETRAVYQTLVKKWMKLNEVESYWYHTMKRESSNCYLYFVITWEQNGFTNLAAGSDTVEKMTTFSLLVNLFMASPLLDCFSLL